MSILRWFLRLKSSVSHEQNPNFFPKQSERGLICAPRPGPPAAGGKTKKISSTFSVLLRRFRLLKEQSYFNIFVCSFLRPHGETRRFLSVFCGSLKLCASDRVW